jgi:hypothetical protein
VLFWRCGTRSKVATQRTNASPLNTHKFFHLRSTQFLHSISWTIAQHAFAIPALAPRSHSLMPDALVLSFAQQYLGLLAERYYFSAATKNP